MKIPLCLLLLVGFLSTVMKMPNQDSLKMKNAKVILNLDDSVCSEAQWVYLRDYKDWISSNEAVIFDSVFVEKGQHVVTLNAAIPKSQSAHLLFGKNGPVALCVMIEPDSCLRMNIAEEDGWAGMKQAEQGTLNNKYYQYRKRNEEYRQKLAMLLGESKKEEADILQVEWFNKLKEELAATTIPCLAYEIAIGMKVHFPSRREEVKKYIIEAAERFPKDERPIRHYAGIDTTSIPPSAEANRADKRVHELMEQRRNIPSLDLSLGQELRLSFLNKDGNKVSTSDKTTDYVLVDFWASWCKPCRKEIPVLKQAIQQYGNHFLIYAVSLDANREAWQKAINQDSTESFTHVIGTYSNGQPTRLLLELKIKSIPANLLLDKQHRIIAKDIRGERLIQVLDSLMK